MLRGFRTSIHQFEGKAHNSTKINKDFTVQINLDTPTFQQIRLHYHLITLK